MSEAPVLVVVPCGRSKIWHNEPDRGPVAAAVAYTGTPFRLNRQYAERFSDAWIVLSAKNGLIASEFMLPSRYEVSFKHPATGPISDDCLRDQVREQHSDRYLVVVGLGGKEYRSAAEVAFADQPVRLAFPFAGLPLGKSLQAAKTASLRVNPEPRHGRCA